MDLRVILKYFLHGVAFGIIVRILSLLLIFIFLMLIFIGYIIGFFIGLVMLFFLVGGINSFLTNLLWSIKTATDWKSLLGHGFLLFILLVAVEIPSIVIGIVVPDPAITIGLFVVYAFIDGLVAKNVAGWWKEQKCIQCGRELPKYAKECPYCKKQEKERAKLPKVCPKCGKKLLLNYKICPQCGQSLPNQDV